MNNKGSLALRRWLVTELAAFAPSTLDNMRNCQVLKVLANVKIFTFRATKDPGNSADVLAQEDSWSGPLNSQDA